MDLELIGEVWAGDKDLEVVEAMGIAEIVKVWAEEWEDDVV